jgi:hypothetical protein|tara:strand:+ start:2127 stop:6248 length:4122 start_codon:yes stop_codon:yes gene_type:complete
VTCDGDAESDTCVSDAARDSVDNDNGEWANDELALTLDDTTEQSWLDDVESDKYNDKLAPDRQVQPWLHGLADLPSVAEYRRLSRAPEPDAYVNPEGWRVSAPFRGGIVHGDDPVKAAQKWRDRIGPSMSKSVLRWIEEGQFTLHPSDESPIDLPRPKQDKRAQSELDRSIHKQIKERTVRLWNRSEEGDPAFTTPVFAIPKKQDTEVYRLIDDFRLPNERLKAWKVRFERLAHLGATGARVGDFAASIDKKSGYFAVGCGPAKFLAFKARIRYSWLLDLCGGDAAKATSALAAEGLIQPGPVAPGDDPFVEVTLAWIAMIMGLRTAAAVYSRLVRQLLKKWRKADGIACINYLDDTLVTAHSQADLRAKLRIMIKDCTDLGLPISFEKSCLQPVQRIVFCGYLLDFATGKVHIPNEKAVKILTNIEAVRQAENDVGEVALRALAKVLGQLMAASRALQPVRLWSRECYALIRARNKSEWDAAVKLSPGARDELCFWATYLLKWNAVGRQLFGETRPVEVTVTGDSGPQGWGARVQDGLRVKECYDQFSPVEAAADQTEREMLGLQRSLAAADVDGVDFSDRVVRATIHDAEAAELLRLQPSEAVANLRQGSMVTGKTLQYQTDNMAVRKYARAGGGRALRLNKLVKQLWLWLLQRGARLDVNWIAGAAMVLNGVDAFSRRRWAVGAAWRWRRPAFDLISQWIRRQGWTPYVISAAKVSSGEAYTLQLTEPTISICFPGQNSITDWVTHLVRQRSVACIVAPQWHGPAMSALLNGKCEELHLGPATVSFVAEAEIPSWQMVATLVDFRRRVKGAPRLTIYDDETSAQSTPMVPTDAATLAALGHEVASDKATYTPPRKVTFGKQFSSDTEGDGPTLSWAEQFAAGAAQERQAQSDMPKRQHNGPPTASPCSPCNQQQEQHFVNREHPAPAINDWSTRFAAGARAAALVSTLVASETVAHTSRRQWQRSTRGGGLIGGGGHVKRRRSQHNPATEAQAWILGSNSWGRKDRPDTQDMSPDELLQHGEQLQRAARAESTRTNYLHWWRVFAEFCVDVKWAATTSEVPLPVAVNVLLMWVARLSSKFAATTINISLAAVSVIHASHQVPSPTTNRAILNAVEGVARTEPVRGVTETVVVTPDMIRMFLRLDAVTGSARSQGRNVRRQWSSLRLKRAVAMAVTGFVGYCRKGELDALDRCDVSRQADSSTLVIKSAKNDAVGRGRSTVIGAKVGDAAVAEQAIWDWIEAAGLTISPQCSKAKWPSERCEACGPLFPQLVGKHARASKKPWGKGAAAVELQGMLAECVRRRWLPSEFDVRRLTPISLRRGGNSAAAAAGASSLLRAAQGRWLCTETPDQKYTMLHHTEMVDLATTIFSR